MCVAVGIKYGEQKAIDDTAMTALFSMRYCSHHIKDKEFIIMKEYILCAAIWYKDIPLVKPSVLDNRGIRPYNIDRGIVFCGWRHPNCIYQKYAITGLRDAESGENEQGFLTNKNRFVNREEAAIIAFNAGQITKELNTLYSEDLY